MKLTTKDINELARALNALFSANIVFSDFDFNLDLARLDNEVQPIGEVYDKTYLAMLATAKITNIPLEQKDLDKMLAKKHEINIPVITLALLKKTGPNVQIPISALSTFLKYISEVNKK